MTRRVLAFFLLGAAAVCLCAFDWPLSTVVITSTFGEHRGDHFHSGIDLGGGEQPVYAIAAGELVFSYQEDSDFSSLPVGLGNYLVLQHQGGIRSLYSHLKAGSIDPRRRAYDRSEPLGIVGSSGYSSGKHLHLSIIDTEMETVINPLLLLPPYKDAQPPVIRTLYIRSGRELMALSEGMTVNKGETEVFGNLYDLREDVSFLWKLAPYRVFLYQDGREVASFIFDSLHRPKGPEKKGTSGDRGLVLINTQASFADIYESEWLFRLGQIKLVPGDTVLTVFVSDFAGNESSQEYALLVRG